MVYVYEDMFGGERENVLATTPDNPLSYFFVLDSSWSDKTVFPAFTPYSDTLQLLLLNNRLDEECYEYYEWLWHITLPLAREREVIEQQLMDELYYKENMPEEEEW